MLDFNLSNCPQRYHASPAQEEEADLLTSIRLVSAGLDALIRSQPALPQRVADECRPEVEELSQKLARLLN